MDYLILSITAGVIVFLAIRQIWREFQATWRDMDVEIEEDDGDITNFVPLAIVKKNEKKLMGKSHISELVK